MKRPASTLASVATAAFVSLSLTACYNAEPKPESVPEQEPRRGKSYAAEKAELLYRMDREMNAVISKYTKELDGIRVELETRLAALAPPSQLLSVERAFRGFGAAEHERYLATIDAYVGDAVAKTEALVGREKSVDKEAMAGAIEEEALRIAATIGGDGRGAGYGFVSGVEEVDERAHVTVEMLRGIGDVPGLRDLGELRKAEAVELSQLYRHEVTEAELATHAPQIAANVKPATEGMLSRVGRFVLYQSEALEGFRMKDADATAVVVAFQGERLPDGRDWQFVQGIRNRVIRSGVIVRDFGWRLDPSTRLPNGRIPLGGEQIDTSFLATETIYPSINLDHIEFANTRDFTLVNDYATGIVDAASGEWLGALRWQVRWIVSLPGEVRLVPGVEPSFDADALVLRELVKAGPTESGGVREAAPSDLLAQRIESTVEAEEPKLRDLGGGVLELIVESRGRDRRSITAAGRKFLASRRLALVTHQAGFAKVYDGNRQRYVLTITSLPKDSALRDLGFRVNDDIQALNGVAIHEFAELWDALAERANERRFEIDLIRDGALRRFTFEIEAVPADAGNEPIATTDDTAESRTILDRLFRGETTAIPDVGG
ncbi:MAG: hypothetical protein IPH13_18710 [Planctomycetes bacterium]|nr:hypothetical protein [Planctomycetota bacterium]MCC7170767.1 hypothetical protein [Planctomycetota bacterium]